MKKGYLLIRSYDYLGKNRPPIDLIILREYFKNKKIDCNFIDMDWELNKNIKGGNIEDKINKILFPKILDKVILKLDFQSFMSSKLIAEIIKKNYPSVQIILSGKIAILNKKNLKDEIIFDKILEKELLNYFLGDFPLDYNNLPIIKSKYLEYPKLSNILVKKGCKFSCTFCNAHYFFEKSDIPKSYQNIMIESDFYWKKNKLNKNDYIRLEADNFFDKESEIDSFLTFKKNKAIKFGASIRCSLLSRQVVDKLIKAGFSYLFLGLESTSERLLKQHNKFFNTTKVIDYIEYAMSKGIIIEGNLLCGLPSELLEEALDTLFQFIKLKMKYLNSFILDISIYNAEKGSIMYQQLNLNKKLFIKSRSSKETEFTKLQLDKVNFNLVPHLYTIKSLNYDTIKFYDFSEKYLFFLKKYPITLKKINFNRNDMKQFFYEYSLDEASFEIVLEEKIKKLNLEKLYDFEKRLFKNEDLLSFGEDYIYEYAKERI